MERLTQRNEHDTSYYIPECFEKCDGLGCSEACNNCHVEDSLIEKLGAYEDAEEQGLLINLPCKVGDTVYQITRDFISEYRIRNFIHYDNGNIWFDWECTKGIYINVKGFHIDDVGKTVFLTKEEAEQKLESMQKGE